MDGSIGSSEVSLRHPQLPPGFRFHPTDEELVIHYLKRKVSSSTLAVSIIAEVNIYKFDPWELPAKATYGEHEWYFFSPRERKYPNGARPNRAATSGYWKATGTDRPVMSSSTRNQKVGVKKALVFYVGKPPKGTKTGWIMHEYRLLDNKTSGIDFVNKKSSSRLDDWVLCRIYRKNDSRRSPMDQDRECSSVDDMLDYVPSSLALADQLRPPSDPLFDDCHPTLYDGMITNFPLLSPAIKPQLPSTLSHWEEKNHYHPAEASETTLERNRSLLDMQQVTGMDSSTAEGSNGVIASLLSQMDPNSFAFTSLDSNGGFRWSHHMLRSGLNWYAS